MRASRALAAFLLAAIVPALAHCKKDAPSAPAKTTEQVKAPVKEVAEEPPEPPREGPLLVNLAALETIPKGAALVVAVEGIAPMLERLGYADAKKAHPALMAPLAEESKAAVGADITDPASLATLGIKSGAPVTFSAWYGDEPVALLTVEVRDEEALRGTMGKLAALAKQELGDERVGDARVLSLAGDDMPVVIVRGKTAGLLMKRTGAVALAKKLAVLPRTGSVASREDIAVAVKALGGGEQVSAFVDVTRFARLLVQMESPSASAEEVATRADSMVAQTMGANALAVLAGSVSPDGIVVNGALTLDPESPLRLLLAKTPGTPAILSAVTEHPVWLLGGRFDIKALYRAFGKAATLGGEQEAAGGVVASALEVLGIDSAERLDSVLTGDVGFAVTGKLDMADLDKSEDEIMRHLGVTATVETKGAETATAILGAVTRKLSGEPTQRVTEADGRWTVDGWMPRPVHFGAVGAQAIASTDPAAVRRMPEAGSLVTALDSKGAKALLDTKDIGLVGVLDLGVLVPVVTWSGSSAWDREIAGQPGDSEARKAAIAEYKSKRAELDKAQRALTAGENADMAAAAGKLGLLIGRAKATDAGMSGAMGLFPRGTDVKGLFSAMLDLGGLDTKWKAERKKVWALMDELSAMEQKLSAPVAEEAPKAADPSAP